MSYSTSLSRPGVLGIGVASQEGSLGLMLCETHNMTHNTAPPGESPPGHLGFNLPPF